MSNSRRPRRRFGRVIIVGIDHQELIVAHECLGREDGVGGAFGLFLNGEVEGQPVGGDFLAVVFAQRIMFGPDHQADAPVARVGEGGEHIIEERPIDRHEGFDAGVRDFVLLGTERAFGSGVFAHARAESAGEDDDFVSQGEAPVNGSMVRLREIYRLWVIGTKWVEVGRRVAVASRPSLVPRQGLAQDGRYFLSGP